MEFGKTGKFPTKSALHEHVRQMVLLERLCARFPLVVRALQAQREPFRVADEADLGALLGALLTLDHDEIRPLSAAPGIGGTPRTGFFLPFEKIVVVAHLAGTGFTPANLQAQLNAALQIYKQRPECRTLVFFVYDPDGCLPQPRTLEADLSRDTDALTVRVYITPRH